MQNSEAVLQDFENEGYPGCVTVNCSGPELGDHCSTELFQTHDHVSCEDASYSVLDRLAYAASDNQLLCCSRFN